MTQVSHRHSQGRAYYDKKLAEGKTRKEALRSLKRQISDAVFTRLRADARRAAARAEGPGGQTGYDSAASVTGSHPRRRLFGQATPGPSCHPTTVMGVAVREDQRPHVVQGHAQARELAAQQPPGRGQPCVDDCHAASAMTR